MRTCPLRAYTIYITSSARVHTQDSSVYSARDIKKIAQDIKALCVRHLRVRIVIHGFRRQDAATPLCRAASNAVHICAVGHFVREKGAGFV